MHNRCARCRRPIREPVVVEGKGYGKVCAAKVGDLLTQPALSKAATTSRRRARRGDERQLRLEST